MGVTQENTARRFFREDGGVTAWATPWEKVDDESTSEIRYSLDIDDTREYLAGVVTVRTEESHKIIDPSIHVHSNLFLCIYAQILNEAVEQVYESNH